MPTGGIMNNYNPLIDELYIMCNYVQLSPETYYLYRKELVETFAIRSYSFGWKFRYAIKLTLWKTFGI